MKGKVELFGRNWIDGKLVDVYHEVKNNLITHAGFDAICALIGGTQPAKFAWIAIGTGTAGNDTATLLATETARQAATYAHTNGQLTFTLTATFTSVSAATEYGCFNVVTANTATMLNTAAIGPVTADSLEIVATFTLS
jgi:hypothetical protein